MNAVEAIVNVYEEGYSAILLTGRSLNDLTILEKGKLGRLEAALRRTLWERFNIHLIRYSMAEGIDWDETRIADAHDRRTIETALRTNHLLEIPQDQNETVRVMRGIASLSRTPTEGLQRAGGSPLRFGFLIDFSEHLLPGSLANGSQTDVQLVAIELAHLAANSLALRASGNFIIFFGRFGLIDELVCSSLKHVHLPQPGKTEKKEFIEATLRRYDAATFEPGLTVEGVVALTTNTPNRSAEDLIRASHRSGRQLTAKELSRQKSRDVEELSEGTLVSLDTSDVEGVQLYGKNIQKPKEILEYLGESLLQGNPLIPANILLAGAPGTGKTILAKLAARKGKVAAYQMISPKSGSGIVGESERKSRLQQQMLKEAVPNIAFADEVTELLPMTRSDFDGDSGATKAVTAELLTALSDETRRGKSLLIGTTNCPWRIGAAMSSRFVVLPVLQPLRRDYAGIVVVIASHIAENTAIDKNDSRVLEAAQVYYAKGASPRDIRNSLVNTMLQEKTNKLTPELIIFAAHDLCSTTDRSSAIFADLFAIQSTSSRSFLPWSDTPHEYDFPDYLNGIVNEQTGEINGTELNKRINELKPYANV